MGDPFPHFIGVVGNLANLYAVQERVMVRLKHRLSITHTGVCCKTSGEEGMVVKVNILLLTANASTTEESCEGKLHAGISKIHAG